MKRSFENWLAKNYGNKVGEFTLIILAIIWLASFGVGINLLVIC